MKAKDQTYYQKLVIGGQWKKVAKVIAGGTQQERDWILDALGMAAARSDEHYNQLMGIFHEAADKPTKLSAIRALGSCARSGALSQLELLGNSTEDPEIQAALTEARHNLRASIK